MTDILSLRALSCILDGRKVVDAVNLDVAAGEIVCLLGHSGCGKTTSLRLAGGLETPSSGAVFLDDQSVSRPDYVLPPEKRGIGFLFQDYALFPHLTLVENISFGLRGMTSDSAKRRIAEMLDAVGLTGYEKRYPEMLSGGEQQRAALARALAPNPRLVLMDEPFANLDPQLRDEMRDLTVRVLRDNRAAALIVTHDAADALRMADRIAVQRNGRIVQTDTPETIFNAPADLPTAEIFGPVNAMAATQNNGGLACALGNIALPAPAPSCQIGFRPEDVQCGQTQDAVTFTGKIILGKSLGRQYLVQIELADGQIIEGLLNRAEKPVEDKFSVPLAHIMLFTGSESETEEMGIGRGH